MTNGTGTGMSGGCDSTPLLNHSLGDATSNDEAAETSSKPKLVLTEQASSSGSPQSEQSPDTDKNDSKSSPDNGDVNNDDSRHPFLKSESGISLKNRGHLTRQKTEESEGSSSQGEDDSLL